MRLHRITSEPPRSTALVRLTSAGIPTEASPVSKAGDALVNWAEATPTITLRKRDGSQIFFEIQSQNDYNSLWRVAGAYAEQYRVDVHLSPFAQLVRVILKPEEVSTEPSEAPEETQEDTGAGVGKLRPFEGFSNWTTKDVAPALRVQVHKGQDVRIEQIDPTDPRKGWRVIPVFSATQAPAPASPTMVLAPSVKVKKPLLTLPPIKKKAHVGLLPLLIPAATAVGKGIGHMAQNQKSQHAAILANPWGVPAPQVSGQTYSPDHQPYSPWDPNYAADEAAGLMDPGAMTGDTAIGLSEDGVGGMIESPHLSDPLTLIDSDGHTRRLR